MPFISSLFYAEIYRKCDTYSLHFSDFVVVVDIFVVYVLLLLPVIIVPAAWWNLDMTAINSWWFGSLKMAPSLSLPSHCPQLGLY